MNGLYWIYCIENKINGKKYIGYTINPNVRWKRHKLSALKSTNQYIHKAIRYYGADNFWFRCISYAFTKEDGLAYEMEMIKLYKSNNKKYGYNLTEGGAGNFGHKHTEKTKKLLSNLAKKRIGPLNSFYGKNHKQNTIENTRGENNKQSKLTEQSVIKLVNLYYTGNFTEQDLANIFNVKRQTVNDIFRRKRWKHIPIDIVKLSKAKSLNRNKVIAHMNEVKKINKLKAIT